VSAVKTARLTVTLEHVEPAVVRVLDVPAGALLSEVHDLLQAAFGWTNSHLHQFVADGIRYGVPDLEWIDEDEHDESGVKLRALGGHVTYLYDFGDGWEHDVHVIGPGGDRPSVVAEEGACPPEDVGGPGGYREFRSAMTDPGHPEHERCTTWAGSWRDGFDLAATDLLVRQTAGAVPGPVRLLLDLTADGVRLTPGGRLPRAVVRQVQDRYPDWHVAGDVPARIEDDLPPLAVLHDLMRDVGLLRLRNGVLSPTRAATDEVETIRRLRSWFGPDSGYESMLVGASVAGVAATGPCRTGELAARVHPYLGHGWMTADGRPVDEGHIRRDLYRYRACLVGLDLVAVDDDMWSAGPSARWLLPRATALAHLWAETDRAT
jgi:hypothetical protein